MRLTGLGIKVAQPLHHPASEKRPKIPTNPLWRRSARTFFSSDQPAAEAKTLEGVGETTSHHRDREDILDGAKSHLVGERAYQSYLHPSE
jgi:hypothetical protein